LRELDDVADGVSVAISRIMSTTSTVVAWGDSALLIDPGWLPSELEELANTLQDREYRVLAGFATHAHHDHLLWHPRFGEVPRWASPRTAELAVTQREVLVEYLGPGFPADLVDLMGHVSPVDGEIPPDGLPGGVTAELVVHDGHAPGHTAVWLPEPRVLVAGDMLSEREVPLPFDPDDLPAYLAALDRLAPYVARASVLIPGHGIPTATPMARLDADRRYLDAVLAGRAPDDPRLADPEMAEYYERLVAMVGEDAGRQDRRAPRLGDPAVAERLPVAGESVGPQSRCRNPG
jgi:glyoxylase-like metal-dependent hydrolase (beta-lactamase superfamily II)